MKGVKLKIERAALFAFIATVLIRGFSGSGINMGASLFLKPVSQELGVGIGTLSIFFSIASLVMIFWLPVAGRLIRRYNIKMLVIIASLLQGLSFASLGLFNNVIFFYVMTVPQTLGAGILVNLLGPMLIHRYFKNKTATALGIQMAIVWGFAAVLQPALAFVINGFGYRIGYFAMGLSAAIVGVLSGAFLLKSEKDSQNFKTPLDKKTGKNVTRPRISLFVLLFLFMAALTGVAVFAQHVPSYAQMLGFPTSKIGITVALSSVGSALGAFLIGIISDKLGIKNASFSIIGLWGVAIIGFLFCKQNFTIFAVSAFLHGVCSSSVGVLFPSLTSFFYGEKNYEKMYSRLAISAPGAAIILIPAYGFLYDYTSSYTGVLALLLFLLFVTALIAFSLFIARGISQKHNKIKKLLNF